MLFFWRLTNTWIKNNISRQNSEHEVGWWKILIPENLELEIRTGILQPAVTSCVLRLDSATNLWVFISKHSSHLCETWQAGSFPRLQPFDELFYCKSQSRGSPLPCNGHVSSSQFHHWNELILTSCKSDVFKLCWGSPHQKKIQALAHLRPGRIRVGRWNERSALHSMCDAE